jgi:beta-glucosidase
MHIPSLSTVAVGLLVAANAVSAKKPNLTWDAAYKKADALVSQMSLEQQVNITTGVGWMAGLCVGNTYPITKPDFPALCLEDGPLGIRFGDNVTAGITGINSAATWDRDLMRQRGEYLGQEFHDKGIHVQLGPGVNFMRNPEGGRGWESGGEDPFLQGVTASEQIIGVQSEGVVSIINFYNTDKHRSNIYLDCYCQALYS